jgi:hypothetical protein
VYVGIAFMMAACLARAASRTRMLAASVYIVTVQQLHQPIAVLISYQLCRIDVLQSNKKDARRLLYITS